MSLHYATGFGSVSCDSGLDDAIPTVPASPGVFAVWPREGDPYVGRAGDLRRRLLRLLKKRDKPGKLLNLRDVAERVEYWPVNSRLQSWLVLYECARKYLPATYHDLLKLRFPPYVRVLTANTFARTQVSTRIHGPGLTFGPFRTRALADQFEHDLLDLFQLRRCLEDLTPSPEHPGCIYGEMNMCLRPCQSVVSIDEYASEARRVTDFLRSEGKSALHTAQDARDRLSAELEFEGAARQHERVERIEALVRLKEELAREVGQLCGVSVQPGPRPGTAGLWFLVGAVWQKPLLFATDSTETIPLDRRLRELVQRLELIEVTPREREEHAAILARWYWSSWRDGIWIRCESLEKLSWRRLATAVSKVVHESSAAASDPVTKGADTQRR
jgi:excinuclease ABC subunit C